MDLCTRVKNECRHQVLVERHPRSNPSHIPVSTVRGKMVLRLLRMQGPGEYPSNAWTPSGSVVQED